MAMPERYVTELLGFEALATTSAGVAWANGYADGEQLPAECLLAAVRTIPRRVKVPLSVDLEAGYSDDATVVEELVTALLDTGVVGINLEDGGASPEREKLRLDVNFARLCGAKKVHGQ